MNIDSQTKYPQVTIIVPVYKVEQYINNCIKSILAQTYVNWELILVDDGSPDKSGEICDKYAIDNSRIRVLHKQNGGLSSARNYALDSHPRGEFITFLDGDDFWHPEYLDILVSLQRKYLADIVQCGYFRGTDTCFPSLNESARIAVIDNHGVFLKEKANVIMCAKLYRVSLFDSVRMPIGLYNEDDWTTWKLYYRARTIVVTNQALYYYTVNPNSIMARLGKKPDLRYINAYNERVAFFEQTREKDLEHCSRLQMCKSLVLTFSNGQLTSEEKRLVKSKFEESWIVLKSSSYISVKYKVLFFLFHIIPLTISKIASKLRA